MQRVAVVGAGTMGKTHAKAYAAIPNAELVVVCDSRHEAAEKLASSLGAEASADLAEALEKYELDIVDICTPTPTHLDYIKMAAAAGKNICCEKPLARTLGHAQEAVSICKEAGVTLFVAQVVRWFPEFRKLRDMIAQGAIGEPVVARTSRGSPHPKGTDDWFADYKQSGGVVLDMVVHDYDWLRWLFGKAKRVYARGLYDARIPDTDYALVTIRFESGVIAHVEGNWARPSGFLATVEVAGTQGLVNFSSAESTPLVIQRKSVDGSSVGVTVPESPRSVSPYYSELQHFVSCLEEGREPEVLPEDGLEAVRIGEAALRSISTGQPVTLA